MGHRTKRIKQGRAENGLNALMFKELRVCWRNGGAKRNVYVGLILVYVEGLLRL